MNRAYVLQVHTGRERKVMGELERRSLSALVPMEVIMTRKQRLTQTTEHILFPGYVFLACTLTDELYHTVRQIPHVVQWLGRPPQPLSEEEQQRILWLSDPGEELALCHPVGGRAAICAGPFMGREGDIVSINRRRGRVRLRLELGGHPFEISLGYTQVDPKPVPTASVDSLRSQEGTAT